LDVSEQVGLVVFDDEEVVGFFLLHDEAGGVLLGVEGIGRDHGAFDGEILEQWLHTGDLVGLVGDTQLADHNAFALEKSAEQVHRRRVSIGAAATDLAIQGDRLMEANALLEDPSADGGVYLVGGQTREGPAEGRLAGRSFATSPTFMEELGREVGSEFGDGEEASFSQQHGKRGDGKHRNEGVAKPTAFAHVGDGAEKLKQSAVTVQG